MNDKYENVRLLLEDTIARLKEVRGAGFRDRQIFVEVLGDSVETRTKFLRFLHDVSTCPPKVIRWCQKQINTHVSK
ncbi:MAG: hypothetical protein WAV50_03800 [Minisyncoccia bacterium]